MAVSECIRLVKSVPPFNLLSEGTEVQQCVMYGERGAGKTTLLYRLKCPNWKKEQLISQMENLKKADKDPSYHYEVLSSSLLTYGIWEIPGDEIRLDLTSMFYKYLKVSVVFFVVDTRRQSVEDTALMERTRNLFDFLLHEQELRMCAFILVLNKFNTGANAEKTEAPTDSLRETAKAKKGIPRIPVDVQAAESKWTKTEQIVRDYLGVEEVLASTAHQHRFKEVAIDCAGVMRTGTEWLGVLSHIAAYLKDSH